MTTFEITPPEPWCTMIRLAYVHSRLIDADEAAMIVGRSVAALRKMVQRDQLPRGAVVYMGKRSYRFRRDKLLPA